MSNLITGKMNYKNIIKSRDIRIKILSHLGWIPDSIMLRLQYWMQTGRKLNLKNPKRFTEKLQVYKMRYRNPNMLRCTDKYEVRSYVMAKGLGNYLIPLIGIYDSIEDIDFKTLPYQFVAKTTDGGGGNQVLVVRDKAKLSYNDFVNQLNKWMNMPKPKPVGREWAYENHYPRRILIEQLIGNGINKDIPDYKFFCFNGVPRYCQVIQNRSTNETIDFYDMEWHRMPFYGLNPKCRPAAKPVAKPQKLDQMKEIAKTLSKDFPFARIDLYDVAISVYFGEITFYPASGYGVFTPDEWDMILGNMFECDF